MTFRDLFFHSCARITYNISFFEHCSDIVIHLKIKTMANKRDLKRTINYITSDMFAECVAASLYSSKPADEDVDGILTAIVMIRTDFICRVSHPEPGMEQKKYYKKLIEDFNKQACEIIDQINNLD